MFTKLIEQSRLAAINIISMIPEEKSRKALLDITDVNTKIATDLYAVFENAGKSFQKQFSPSK
jgi:hypothetical protein